MVRGSGDVTYIDDVTEAVVRLLPRPPAPNPAWSGDQPDPATSRAPWHVYNIGNSQPAELLEVVSLIEQAVGHGQPAVRELLPMQPRDVLETSPIAPILKTRSAFGRAHHSKTG
jgi:UDP-glucuronate 4-epimerase